MLRDRKAMLRQTAKKLGYAVISFLVFGCIWGFVANYTTASVYFPGPIKTLKSLFEHFTVNYGTSNLFGHIWVSLRRVLLGYSIASVLAIALGLIMGQYRVFDAIVSPIFNVIRPIPPVAWIPLAILWFGIGDMSKYFLIGLATFLNVLQNVYAGTKAADPQLIGAARMLGANSRQIFTSVILPTAVPHIFAGLQLGLAAAWGQVLATEMIRSSEGVGWIIIRGMDNNDILQELVGVLIIGVVGFILATVMRFLEGRLCRWSVRDN